MIVIMLLLAAALVAGTPVQAWAAAEKVESPYEDQLRSYSTFHEELLKGKERENLVRAKKNETLRVQEVQLEKEYSDLQTGIESKEESIVRLKTLNDRMKEAQMKMYNQYNELEGLFAEQKAENDRLKTELETNKMAFYQKMLDFYQEEYDMLTDKIGSLEERREAVSSKLEAIKSNLIQKDEAAEK